MMVALVLARERRLQELQEEARTLRARTTTTQAALADVHARIAQVTGRLAELGDARVGWGDFNRVGPFSPEWGADRGRCIDRYYIEDFLERHAADIHGDVLEVHDADYTRQFGGARVHRSDVVDIDATNGRATVIADLRCASVIPADRYDCFIMTQTLHVIYEVRAVLSECRRILKPGGALLATLPCASRIAPEQGLDGDFWRFTPSATRRLFGEIFDPGHVEVRAYGNVLTNVAFLYGLACHELTRDEFEAHDPYFPLLISVRATKPIAGGSAE